MVLGSPPCPFPRPTSRWVPQGRAKTLRGMARKDFLIAYQRLQLAEQAGRAAAADAQVRVARARAAHHAALIAMRQACASVGLPREGQFTFDATTGRVQAMRGTKP